MRTTLTIDEALHDLTLKAAKANGMTFSEWVCKQLATDPDIVHIRKVSVPAILQRLDDLTELLQDKPQPRPQPAQQPMDDRHAILQAIPGVRQAGDTSGLANGRQFTGPYTPVLTEDFYED